MQCGIGVVIGSKGALVDQTTLEFYFSRKTRFDFQRCFVCEKTLKNHWRLKVQDPLVLKFSFEHPRGLNIEGPLIDQSSTEGFVVVPKDFRPGSNRVVQGEVIATCRILMWFLVF